jgi:pyridoxal phosphate enzyme (YggS family)
MSVKENYASFMDSLSEAALRYGRNLDDITVMAVSKTRSVQEIKEASEAGLKVFGENRVDEAAVKFSDKQLENLPLYLIGHLQTNKVKKITPRFSGVHSVDSLKKAELLSRERIKYPEAAPLEILIQVNTSGEESKSGFRDKNEFLETASAVSSLPAVVLKGLMTMAPFTDNEKTVRECFSLCREWSLDAAQYIDGETVLSMGMSSDYRWAVAEGSTLLRIGTLLFGRRNY